MDENINEQRLVRDRQRKLEERVKKEILEHKNDPTFLPDEYRKWRLSGKSKNELDRDYDLCHVWR